MSEQDFELRNVHSALFGAAEETEVLERETANELLAALGYDVDALDIRFDAQAAEMQKALASVESDNDDLTLDQMRDRVIAMMQESGMAARGFDKLSDDDIRRLYQELSKEDGE